MKRALSSSSIGVRSKKTMLLLQYPQVRLLVLPILAPVPLSDTWYTLNS